VVTNFAFLYQSVNAVFNDLDVLWRKFPTRDSESCFVNQCDSCGVNGVKVDGGVTCSPNPTNSLGRSDPERLRTSNIEHMHSMLLNTVHVLYINAFGICPFRTLCEGQVGSRLHPAVVSF